MNSLLTPKGVREQVSEIIRLTVETDSIDYIESVPDQLCAIITAQVEQAKNENQQIIEAQAQVIDAIYVFIEQAKREERERIIKWIDACPLVLVDGLALKEYLEE